MAFFASFKKQRQTKKRNQNQTKKKNEGLKTPFHMLKHNHLFLLKLSYLLPILSKSSVLLKSQLK